MKTVSEMTQSELRHAAHEAIKRELGVVGLVRYLQQDDLGSGNYTDQRWEYLPKGEKVEDLAARILKQSSGE